MSTMTETEGADLMSRVMAVAGKFYSKLGAEDIGMSVILDVLQGTISADDVVEHVHRVAARERNQFNRGGSRGGRGNVGWAEDDATMEAIMAADPRAAVIGVQPGDHLRSTTGEDLAVTAVILPGVRAESPADMLAEAAHRAGGKALALFEYVTTPRERQEQFRRPDGVTVPVTKYSYPRVELTEPKHAREIAALGDAYRAVLAERAAERGVRPNADAWYYPSNPTAVAYDETETAAGPTYGELADSQQFRTSTPGEAHLIAAIDKSGRLSPTDEVTTVKREVGLPRLMSKTPRVHTPDSVSDGLAFLALGSGGVKAPSNRKRKGNGTATIPARPGKRWADRGTRLA